MFLQHLASGDDLMPVKRNINVSEEYIHTKIKTGYNKTKMLFIKGLNPFIFAELFLMFASPVNSLLNNTTDQEIIINLKSIFIW